jgi:anti-sigma factor RsiW
MTCHDVLELVEPIAAGDAPVSDEVRRHFETCPACAAALAQARRVEAALARREAPLAPARFVSAVQQAIRRERWRSEQQVDRVFNLAIAVAVILVVGGLVAVMNVASVLAIAGGAWEVAASLSGQMAGQAVPTLNTYVAAAALLISALAMWWWADRTWSMD